MKNSLTKLTLTQARAGLERKEFSAVELTEAYLAAMERGRGLNAYIVETPELALSQAVESDRRLAQGKSRSLEGIPLGIKDLLCTAQVPTTAASRMLEHFTPPYESTVTRRLFEAGALCLGKTNLDEFAMGSANLTSAFGVVQSPWSQDGRTVVPGGSSGGSSAVVSGGLALAAIGTDTGGSIRQPAAFCGIVGLKPTYGRCSRSGIIAFASSLDQPGPMTRSVADAALMLEVMAGHDPLESTSSTRPVPSYSKDLNKSIRGLKVGIPEEYCVEGLSTSIQNLWNQGAAWLKDAGAEIMSIRLPHTSYALPVYYVVASAEASSNLARYDGVRYGLRTEAPTLPEMYSRTRDNGFGSEVKRRILVGTYVLSHGHYEAYFLKAQKVRRLIWEDFNKAFQSIDVILTPTAPTPPFMMGSQPKDPVTMYLNDILTVPSSLAGLPAISIPAALSEEGLPLGLQLIGPAFEEAKILNVAHRIEQAANFPILPFV